MVEQTKLPLGKLLIKKGVISEDQLRIALIEQKRSSEPLGKLLITLGFVTEATVRMALSENLKQESADLSSLVVDAIALKLIPKEVAKRYRVFPIVYERQTDNLILAMADTSNIVALDQISAMLVKGITISTVLVNESDISRAIDQYYGFELSIDGILHEIETGEVSYQSMASPSDEYSQPMVRLIDALLADAVQNGASDIHFEPEQSFLRIRYRIDGTLRQIRSLHKSYWPAMAVRLKVISNMNIAEARAPQDGRITIRFSGRQIDFRASAQPTTHGENYVLRVLDRQKGIVPLDSLGLAERELNLLKLMIARPDGVILVTGPTGSGKTTTLYCALAELNSVEKKLITVEDPVEYRLAGINQVQVNDKIELNFARVLRSALRQDPDIVLVGEMRDQETAQIGLRAAMTGHLVLSTLHTNDAASTPLRLMDMGVPRYMVGSSLQAVLAQRLVRVICESCTTPYVPTPTEAEWLRMELGELVDRTQYHHGKGCSHCNGMGYRGRTGVYELLEMTRAVVDAANHADPSHFLKAANTEMAGETLRRHAVQLVVQGRTTISEAMRISNQNEE